MAESLQHFGALQPGNLSGVLSSALMFWLAWPVLCGLISYSRGNGLNGVIHGFFWGPLGLVPVLLKQRKYHCPTCGCKTLKRPLDRNESATSWIGASTQAAGPSMLSAGISKPRFPGLPDSDFSSVRIPNMPAPPLVASMPRPMCDPTAARATIEADSLLGWLNGEREAPDMKVIDPAMSMRPTGG